MVTKVDDGCWSSLTAQGGAKIRVTFNMIEGVAVLSMKERTDKLPLGAIRTVTSQAIPNFEQFHGVALQHGPTAASSLWLYWFPAQYVGALKALAGMARRL